MRAASSAALGTTSSAAFAGTSALAAATWSQFGRWRVWPIDVTTGTGEAAMARHSASSENG